jgi:hypothetical protein
LADSASGRRMRWSATMRRTSARLSRSPSMSSRSTRSELASRAVALAGAVRARFHDGGQAGLAHGPVSLAIGIHGQGPFQASARAVAARPRLPGSGGAHEDAVTQSRVVRLRGRSRNRSTAGKWQRSQIHAAMVFEVLSLRQLVFRPSAATLPPVAPRPATRPPPSPAACRTGAPCRRRGGHPAPLLSAVPRPRCRGPPRPVPPGITAAAPVTDHRTSPRMSRSN